MHCNECYCLSEQRLLTAKQQQQLQLRRWNMPCTLTSNRFPDMRIPYAICINVSMPPPRQALGIWSMLNQKHRNDSTYHNTDEQMPHHTDEQMWRQQTILTG